ncbi:hypothetical protein ACHAC9_08030 [Massilia sp. CMS3.1]|uniref:hypothetical protein n=1 Tax=Massilia sp. CMS3.1 TaxID=3373083 RepID=UPI003EE610E9
MKYALILETDEYTRERFVKLVGWLGHTPVVASTADEALTLTAAMDFELIFTPLHDLLTERRQLPGELKRIAPKSAVIAIAANDEEYIVTKFLPPVGACAVVPRHPSLDLLRRLLESNIEGFGVNMTAATPPVERRRMPK